MTLSAPKGDYEMIDSGNGRKLEKVGPYILDRPETRADRIPVLDAQEWENRAHARYEEDQKGKNGSWELLKEMPSEWSVELKTQDLNLKAECTLGNSKHYGFFPEQALNWDALYRHLSGTQGGKALLLFAYTGVASLACRKAGADTFHVESSKASIGKARKNMEMNGLSDIRWVLEDALKFAQRELRRERRYHAIVLDPPSFGRGPDGELWKAEEKAPELFATCAGLLHPEKHLLIGNIYSDRYPRESLQKELGPFCKRSGSEQKTYELHIPSEEGNGVKAGHSLRVEKEKN